VDSFNEEKTMHYNSRCDANHTKFHIETSLFIHAYPNHCVECGGWGGKFYHDDPSAGGVSLSSGCMIEFDPCESCVGEGNCPVCGESLLDTEDGAAICSHCLWNEESEFKGLPNPDDLECECHEYESGFVKIPQVYIDSLSLYDSETQAELRKRWRLK
jgi:hypothetical protein